MSEQNETTFVVTEKAQRPAKMDGTCFYCCQKIGEFHKNTCVLVQRKVKVRLTVEYDISVPAHWDADSIEFHRNESTWCSSNAIDELENLEGCLCRYSTFEYLEDSSEPFLSEE